jgi:hypothetical protein
MPLYNSQLITQPLSPIRQAHGRPSLSRLRERGLKSSLPQAGESYRAELDALAALALR